MNSVTSRGTDQGRLVPELFGAFALFVAVNIFLALTQPQIDVNAGLGWDGVQYATVARQLAEGQQPSAEAPFVYRIGTPLLAVLIAPNDVVSGFRIANLAGNALTVLLLVVWFRHHVLDLRIRFAVLLAFMLAWHGPIRFFWFYPVASEHLAFAANVAVLVAGQRLRDRLSLGLVGVVALVAFAGTLVRETALLAPAVLPLARLRGLRPGRETALLLIPLVAGLLAFGFSHRVGSQTNSYSYLAAIVDWFREKSVFVYVLGWLNAYGPLLVLPFVSWRASLSFLRTNPMATAFLLAATVLGWIGGQDTERYVYWAAPVVYVLAGRALIAISASAPAAVLAGLGFLQIVSERVGMAIPQPRVVDPLTLPPERGLGNVAYLLTPFGDPQYFDLWSFWMPRLAKAILLVEYAVCAIVLFALLTRARAGVSPARRQ
ncbi:MAG TPA: hypothetical protein VEU77_05520 [Candidatus Acidoferrales bacterium]|nr:hypothetical protein [Candidatus Acidoferrales bacterium]